MYKNTRGEEEGGGYDYKGFPPTIPHVRGTTAGSSIQKTLRTVFFFHRSKTHRVVQDNPHVKHGFLRDSGETECVQSAEHCTPCTFPAESGFVGSNKLQQVQYARRRNCGWFNIEWDVLLYSCLPSPAAFACWFGRVVGPHCRMLLLNRI